MRTIQEFDVRTAGSLRKLMLQTEERAMYIRPIGLLHARIFLSMTVEDAKKILGFPPDSNPSSSEIAHAYRHKVLNPDIDLQKVEIAKEVLDRNPSPRDPLVWLRGQNTAIRVASRFLKP